MKITCILLMIVFSVVIVFSQEEADTDPGPTTIRGKVKELRKETSNLLKRQDKAEKAIRKLRREVGQQKQDIQEHNTLTSEELGEVRAFDVAIETEVQGMKTVIAEVTVKTVENQVKIQQLEQSHDDQEITYKDDIDELRQKLDQQSALTEGLESGLNTLDENLGQQSALIEGIESDLNTLDEKLGQQSAFSEGLESGLNKHDEELLALESALQNNTETIKEHYDKTSQLMVQNQQLCRLSTDMCSEMEQWVTSVLKYSTAYGYGYSQDQVIGPENVYPNYGDLAGAWCQVTLDAEQFIEVSYLEAVFVSKVEVYETFNAGGVIAILAYDIAVQSWKTLWETLSGAEVIQEARIFSPEMQETDFKTNYLRLNVNCSASNNWVEIDAIKLTGRPW